MPEFLIRVTRDTSSNIISLYAPDFGLELLEYSNHQDINNNYRTFIIDLLNSHLIKHAQQVIPKTHRELKYVPLNQLQHWESFTIDGPHNQVKLGFFSKTLPIIGHVTNILGMLSGGFITYMTLRLASSDNTNDNHSSSNTLSILGTVLSSIISVIMYIYSDATNMLAGIGHGIDESLAKTCKSGYETAPIVIENTDQNSTCAKKIIFLFAIGAISTNTLILGITAYKQSSSMADQYLDLYPHLTDSERETYQELLRWLVVNLYVSVGAYTFLAFQGSFAIKLVEELSNKFEGRVTAQLQDNRLSRDTNANVLFQYPNTSSSSLLEFATDLQESSLPIFEERQTRERFGGSLS